MTLYIIGSMNVLRGAHFIFIFVFVLLRSGNSKQYLHINLHDLGERCAAETISYLDYLNYIRDVVKQ